MKLLLIDNRVRAIEYITRSLEEDVDYIIFDYETETLESLINQIPIKPYESVGIVQDQDNIPSYTLAKMMGDYDLNDYSTWTTYIEFVSWCVTNLGIKIWDLIECNIDETWQPVISSLQNQFNITIRSSSKQLGNTNLGDNWVFDDGTSLIGIYFTTEINEYPYILGSGYSSSCSYLIDANGYVWGRGYNNYGQLGISTSPTTTWVYSEWTRIYIPYPSTSTQLRVVQISATNTGAVFLTSNGDCYACGYNLLYCLGLPVNQTVYPSSTNVNSYTASNTYPTPTKINISNVKYITGGWSHTIFLLSDGSVTVTGANISGGTCYGESKGDVTYLLKASVLSNVYLISSMIDATMIVFANQPKKIYFFGYNPTVTSYYPSYVMTNILTSNVDIKQIESGGQCLYYVDISHNLYGIGINNIGQLGLGNKTKTTTWTQITGTNNILNNKVLKVSSAAASLQVLTLTGNLYYTGLNSLVTIEFANLAEPFAVPNSAIDTSYTTSLVLSDTGVSDIFSWLTASAAQPYSGNGTCVVLHYTKNGLNYTAWGQITQVSSAITSTNQIIPQQLSFSLIDSAGDIYVIGRNFYDFFGKNVTGTNGYIKVTPVTPFGSPVIKVTNTNRGCLVLLQNGDVWAFGYNQYGELGTTVSASLTSAVGSGDGVKLTFAGIGANTIVFISSGLYHSLFVTSSGAVYSCGLNNYGQLAQGTRTNLTTPTLVSGLTNIKSCCCGLYYSLFLSSSASPDAKYTFYGYNGNNESGGSTSQFNYFFTSGLINGGYNTLITSGFNHSITNVVLSGVTTHYTSGLNNYGQYGLGNTNVYSSATSFSSSIFSQLFAGENRSAGITSSGSLYTWGRNIGTTPVLTDINVTTVYQVTDIGIIYIKNSKYYVAYGSDILASYVYAPLPNITAYSASTNPLTIYSNICFLEGTPVKCDQGMIEIDKIDPETHTIMKKKIVAITETYSTEKELVVIEKDSLRPNVPNKDTVITMEHKVFYKGKMTEASKITKKRQKYNGEKLYNVLMEEHNKMSVNNMLVETLDPANTIGKVFKGLREYK